MWHPMTTPLVGDILEDNTYDTVASFNYVTYPKFGQKQFTVLHDSDSVTQNQ
jgi:hypothetical protein